MHDKKRYIWYKKNRNTLFPLVLIFPSLIFLCLFCLYPMLRSFGYAFTDYQRSRPLDYNWVGFANFVKIFREDKIFISSLLVSVKWVVFQVGLQLVLGMLFALILNQKFKGRGFVRTFCFAPWAVSGVLTTMLWLLIYNEHIGLLNNILKILGMADMRKAWVQNIDTAFWAVALSELWRGIPFFTISLLGGLQTVPTDLYESAKMDGANSWNCFWKITMPYMKESIVFATLMRTIWEFRSVDLIMTMTNGGPVRRTLTLPIYMYQTSIENGKFGYGSALTVILFAILSIYVFIYLKANNFGKGINES